MVSGRLAATSQPPPRDHAQRLLRPITQSHGATWCSNSTTRMPDCRRKQATLLGRPGRIVLSRWTSFDSAGRRDCAARSVREDTCAEHAARPANDDPS
jgi:hypothetical protein